jgi:hypothetical protein
VRSRRRRGNASRLEHPRIPVNHRTYLGVARLGDLADVTDVRESGAGALQRDPPIGKRL